MSARELIACTGKVGRGEGWMAELVGRQADVAAIAHASHGMNFQNPVALDAAILDFLERHPTT